MVKATNLPSIVSIAFLAFVASAPAQAQQTNMSFFVTSAGPGKGEKISAYMSPWLLLRVFGDHFLATCDVCEQPEDKGTERPHNKDDGVGNYQSCSTTGFREHVRRRVLAHTP